MRRRKHLPGQTPRHNRNNSNNGNNGNILYLLSRVFLSCFRCRRFCCCCLMKRRTSRRGNNYKQKKQAISTPQVTPSPSPSPFAARLQAKYLLWSSSAISIDVASDCGGGVCFCQSSVSVFPCLSPCPCHCHSLSYSFFGQHVRLGKFGVNFLGIS